MDYKRILITGINGSGASYLTEHIVQKYPHVDIHGTQRWSSHSNSNLSEMSNNITIRPNKISKGPSNNGKIVLMSQLLMGNIKEIVTNFRLYLSQF